MTIPTTNVAPNWHRDLSRAIRDAGELCDRLGLSPSDVSISKESGDSFPLLVTESYLQRIRSGDPQDPLLRQILPVREELDSPSNFVSDAVGDGAATRSPGMIHKYAGRVLLVATGSCAIHCRYCFRREYPYGNDPKTIDDWTASIDAIRDDASISEVILSGGDPLMLTDQRLSELIGLLEELPQVRRLRIHTRLPIVLPSRVTDELLKLLNQSRLSCWVVVHANHANEVALDCAEGLKRIVQAGIPTLNQAVLLREVNNSFESQRELCERLIDLGVIPYYLHQLDRVSGTSHFEVSESLGRTIVGQLRAVLPGYAVPRFVREIPGETSKTPLM